MNLTLLIVLDLAFAIYDPHENPLPPAPPAVVAAILAKRQKALISQSMPDESSNVKMANRMFGVLPDGETQYPVYVSMEKINRAYPRQLGEKSHHGYGGDFDHHHHGGGDFGNHYHGGGDFGNYHHGGGEHHHHHGGGYYGGNGGYYGGGPQFNGWNSGQIPYGGVRYGLGIPQVGGGYYGAPYAARSWGGFY